MMNTTNYLSVLWYKFGLGDSSIPSVFKDLPYSNVDIIWAHGQFNNSLNSD